MAGISNHTIADFIEKKKLVKMLKKTFFVFLLSIMLQNL